jgi:hypothetical protein
MMFLYLVKHIAKTQIFWSGAKVDIPHILNELSVMR